MDRRETERILGVIKRVLASGERAAIATVVRVRGSAYRREGTSIIVLEDGSYECLLSGGCLEPAVAEAARRVIATGEPTVATYDLEEDSVWGLAIGCSGAVDIRIERVEDDPISRSWRSALEQGDRATLITSLSGVTGRVLLRGNTILGALSDAELQSRAIVRARELLRETNPHAGPQVLGQAELFYDFSHPPPRLVIFGAGHDAEPLARLAWELGFAVIVVDVRESFLTADRFPGATLVASHFERFTEHVQLDDRSFAVIMNHHLERDWESLRFALTSEAPYIGVLGPRTRYQKLLTNLEARGWRPSAARLDRVQNPVGLALGAETPQEIAVSIMSEILAIRAGFDGGFLRGREVSLHRPLTMSLRARS